MASSITVTCPECDKQLKASSDVLGKKIRCKACGATFVGRAAKEAPVKEAPVKEAPAKKAPAKKGAKPAQKDKPAPSANDDNDIAAYGVTHEYLGRRCPNCTTPLDEEQIVCLECGYHTLTRQRARTVKVVDTTGGDIFLHLLPGILCVVLILIVLTLQLLYIFMVNVEMFNEAWYDFLGDKMCKIYSSLISALIIYKSGRFAVNRLFINNKPVEVEDKSRDDDEDED
jgi:DNA-directed RNA polymerase subunit RPC12/RpoP